MLASLDYLGPSLKMTIRSKPIYKTNFGGFASMVLIAVGVVAFFGFGNDIFERKKPRVTFNRLVSNAETISKIITDSNFLFSIYDQYSDLPIPDYDRRFYTYYDYLYYSGDGTDNQYHFKIPVEKCGEGALNLWEGYYYVDPSTYYCFPSNSTIDVLGIMNQGRHSIVRLQTDFCINNTDPTQGPVKTDCIPKEDTQTLLASKRIQMHYIVDNSLIDSFNYTSPGSIIGTTGLVNTNAFSWTRLNILFKQVNVMTDTGFFIEDLKSSSFQAIESIISESIYSSSTNTIFSHFIGNSKWKETYTRTYIKIQDVFAMMGGFLNASMIILSIIVEYMAKPNIADLFNQKFKYLKVDQDDEGFNKSKTSKKFEKKMFYKNNRVGNLNSNISKINIGKNVSQFVHTKISLYPITNLTPQQDTSGLNILNNNRVVTLNATPSSLLNNLTDKKIDDNEIKLFIENLKKKSKENFYFRMNFFVRLLRVCFSKSNTFSKKYESYFKAETKMNKVVSLENFAKMTRFMKLIKLILLEEHQAGIIETCPNPPKLIKQKKLSLNQYGEILIEKMKNSKYKDEVNSKLYQFLKD